MQVLKEWHQEELTRIEIRVFNSAEQQSYECYSSVEMFKEALKPESWVGATILKALVARQR